MDVNLYRDLVRRAIGDRSQTDVALLVGISPAYVSQMLKGRVPRRPVLRRFASVLGLTGEERDALLEAAGFVRETDADRRGDAASRPPLTYEPDLDDLEVELREGWRQLSPEGREALLGMVRHVLKVEGKD